MLYGKIRKVTQCVAGFLYLTNDLWNFNTFQLRLLLGHQGNTDNNISGDMQVCIAQSNHATV
jgi:hypothetical protein